ncbi:MAG: right-handed parallel beta-helix repeat-containing protein [Bacteroidia bacterium]
MRASTVIASSFGWNANDATTAFQAAVQSGADTVIVDLQAGDWMVLSNNFYDIDSLVLIFQPGVRLVAIPGGFPNVGDCLLRFIRCTDITVIGYGATFQMQKPEYTSGEWRHTLSINNCSRVRIYGLTLRDSGGDGILISGDPWWNSQLYSEDIYISDVISDNNRRQGISVISVQNLRVENSLFMNTNGTLPEGGVDLEPDNPNHRMVNVNFTKCVFKNNYGSGIYLAFSFLDSTSLPVSVTFDRCMIENNHDTSNSYAPTEINASGPNQGGATGSVTFRQCLVHNSQWTAVYARKIADDYFIQFDNCAFKNVSQANTPYNDPIFAEVTDYGNPCPRFGGLGFNHCLLQYSTNYKPFWGYEFNTTPGLGNVSGDLYVINPFLNAADFGNAPQNVTLTLNQVTAPPATQVSLGTPDRNAQEGPNDVAIYQGFRTSAELNTPYPILFDTAGTANAQTDYVLLPGFLMLPFSQVSTSDTLIALRDSLLENTESIFLSIRQDPCYSQSPNTDTLSLFILNTLLNTAEHDLMPSFSFYPNPANAFITVRGIATGTAFCIYDSKLRACKRGLIASEPISCADLDAGVYYIQIGDRAERFVIVR